MICLDFFRLAELISKMASAPFDMLVGKEVVLTIFIIPLALGAKTELQILPILLCPAANCTFMLSNSLRLAHLLTVDLFPAYLMGRYSSVIPGTEKENQKIHYRSEDCHSAGPVADNKHESHPHCIDNPQPLSLKGDDKIQPKLRVRIYNRKRHKQRHRHIFRAEIKANPRHWYPGSKQIDEIKDKRSHKRTQQPANQIDIVPERTDCLFNGSPNKIITGQEKNQEQDIDGRRNQKPRDNPPYLPLQDEPRL